MLITKRNLLAHRILANDFEVEYETFDLVLDEINTFNKSFDGQIFKISKAFADGMFANSEKLFLLFVETFKNDNLFIYETFYDFFKQEFKAILDFGSNLICCEITNEKLFIAFYSGLKDEMARLGYGQLNGYCCVSNAILKGLGVDRGEDVYYELFRIIVVFLMFKKYANVEETNVLGKSKANQNGEKIKNETDHSIQYMDCKWFTTIVRSEGFKVRGHFRLQPKKKDGEWTKELIYIEEFSKNGYTSVAKKLDEV